MSSAHSNVMGGRLEQVSTVLLSAAFVYDIFWVFISPLFFAESVMIVVCASNKLVTFSKYMVLPFLDAINRL